MIKIVLSYEDNYIDRVEKIKEEFFDDVEYFYVEDYINKNISRLMFFKSFTKRSL
jgi:hydroxypyruvate isomerase